MLILRILSIVASFIMGIIKVYLKKLR